jgi:hypothetical protein
VYKSDWGRTIERLMPSDGGSVSKILVASRGASMDLKDVLPAIFTGQEARRNEGIQKSKQAAASLISTVRGISTSSVMREIHELRLAFAEGIGAHPALRDTLSIGQSALAALEEAYDDLLRYQALDKVPALVAPALRLSEFWEIFGKLRIVFDTPQQGFPEDHAQSIVEVSGIETVAQFRDWIAAIQLLFEVAQHVADVEHLDGDDSQEFGLRLVSVESGSPIKIVIEAGERSMLKLLGLIGTGVRSVFRLCNRRGEIRDHLELIETFRRNGIAVPAEAEHELGRALVASVRKLRLALPDDGRSFVKIDGEFIDIGNESAPALPSGSGDSKDASSFPKRLEGPSM